MSKAFRSALIIGLILLALAGGLAAAVIHYKHLSFATAQHSAANINRGDLLIYEDFGAPVAKPTLIKSIPNIGYGLDFLRQPLGLVLAVYVPALLLVIYEIKRMARHYTHRVYEVV